MFFLIMVVLFGFSLSASDVNSHNSADNKRFVLLTGEQVKRTLLLEICPFLSLVTGGLVMSMPHSDEPCVELEKIDGNNFKLYFHVVHESGEKEVKMIHIKQDSSQKFDVSIDAFKGAVTLNDDRSMDCHFEGLNMPGSVDVNAIQYSLLK